jgi:predicted TPR repeat methyltransferase
MSAPASPRPRPSARRGNDTDIVSIDYANPAVAAGLVARHVPSLDNPILDAGAGTGILGGVLSNLGYRDLTGVDISDGMLAKAQERGAYRRLQKAVLGEVLDFADTSFGAVTSIGVFVQGHAPPAAFDELLRITRPGGYFIFTVGTAAWNEGGFGEKITSLEVAGCWELIEATKPFCPCLSRPVKAPF